MYSGHIFESNNADGNYLCLPDTQDGSTQAENPFLNAEEIKDAYGNIIPCAACSASGRSAIFTYPDNSACPAGWTAEYSGHYATNPKWPGENICVNCIVSTQLSQTPGGGLAVIAKGSFNSYESINVVACVVCSI